MSRNQQMQNIERFGNILENIQSFYLNMSESGQKILFDEKREIRTFSNGRGARNEFIRHYCDDPDSFSEYFTEDLVRRSRTVIAIVDSISESSTVVSSARRKQAEYLWTNCSPEERREISELIDPTSEEEKDFRQVNKIMDLFKQFLESMPPRFETPALEHLYEQFKNYEKELFKDRKNINTLVEKSERICKEIDELLSEYDFSTSEKNIKKHSKRLLREIDENVDKLRHSLYIRSDKYDTYTTCFTPSLVICNICCENQVEIVTNCGHVFCKTCLNNFRMDYDSEQDDEILDSDSERKCATCNQIIHQVIKIHL